MIITFLNSISQFFVSFASKISLKTAFSFVGDLIFVWILLYYLLSIVKRNQRTLQIFKGILLIAIIKLAAAFFNFAVISWLIDLILNWGVVAAIIVFQPEVRTLLEKLGQTRDLLNRHKLTQNEKDTLANVITEACIQMSEEKTGALIAIERKDSLLEYIHNSTQIDANLNAHLLLTIFMEGTRLHDGAVIIQGNRISSASAFFNPTNRELSPKYGARHRAALGISEVSDAFIIVVSEETGNISFAVRGELKVIDKNKFREMFLQELDASEVKESGGDF